MNEQIWQKDASVSLVIRSDFTHPQEWDEIQSAIAEPQTYDKFTAMVEFVDDLADEGLTTPQLLELMPSDVDHSVAFLVDSLTLTHPHRPILVINLYDGSEDEDDGEEPQYGATFRVVPSEMWSVQNNLALSNMDWNDFAESVDDDGIFRGFR
ncbi:hypothetical protein HH310_29815 [Actinoplanes sp. TBRC 11911]|uniref:DUF6924 domain-containing protein n=1 Tax=Actinoplanes sp. TBRC 11911 TaxID=2729386 RepID=UPI00145F605B|nr:hypothetical protein [Actinoplanes sp. TBRC 11911]NMO55367.1 hypothetical protein [Actinoplanes sp. TBRC 11911]